MTRLLVLLLSLTLVSCSGGEITAENWKGMSPQDKALVVESLRGHEAARDAKGGGGRSHPQSTVHYRDEIDKRYAAGDARSVNQIWDELAGSVAPESATATPR